MSVVVDAARMETVEQWREVTGELKAVQRALLAAEEDGVVVGEVREQGMSSRRAISSRASATLGPGSRSNA